MKIFQTAVVLISILIAINQSIADSEQSQISLDAITVTANKQEENIQEVPMGVTAFDGFDIEDKNINSVVELAYFVPNLMLVNQGLSGAKVPSLRGVAADLATYSVSTGMFIDGVPILSYAGFNDPLLDIERVEVLRGPQGTLYGKNAEVGVINIITRQPDNTFRGKIFVDGGEDEKREAAFTLDGPIFKDKFFFGLIGQYYSKDGFITNVNTGNSVNDEEHWFGKGKLRWEPTDFLNIQLLISHLNYDNAGSKMGLSQYGASVFGLSPSGSYSVASDEKGEDISSSTAQALKVTYNLPGDMELTSITTHRIYEDALTQDYDFNPIEFMHTTTDNEYKKVSQELRLASSNDKMQWIAGFYYDKDDDSYSTITSSIIPAMTSVINRNIDAETYAVFGQLRYMIISGLGVTGGLRYEKQERSMVNHITDISYEGSWDDLAPKITLDYAFTPDILVYTTVAKGFRSGGFNFSANDPDYMEYDSEELWSYEVGIKTQLLDNRLLLNGAIFYMDIDNMQVAEWPTPTISYITNSAKAHSYGVELEMQMRLTSQFTLTGNFGYSQSEFDDFKDSKGDYANNKAAFAPQYTFSIGGQYRTDKGLYAGVDLVGYGKMYLDTANEYPRDAYQLVNAKVGYEAENWDIYLYGKNIFDKDYSYHGYAGGYYILYSAPREIGIKLTYRL